jgi:hypothetical protein
MTLFRFAPALGRGFRAALLVAAVAAVAATAGGAAAAEHYYRDDLTIRTGPPARYVIEVPQAAAMHGGYFKVTTDARGRAARVSYLVDGTPTSDTVYEYSGSASLPYATATYRQGVLTGRSTITRDAAGRATRVDYFTAQGAPTGHTITNWVAGHAELANYTADGTRRWHSEEYFSSDGVLTRSVTQGEGNNAYNESIYDTARGVVKSAKQFTNGQLQISYVNTYDNDDDLIRQDLYDDKGTWYGAKIYKDNLLTRKLYKFSNGISQESQIKYDARRWAVSAQMFINGSLVCSFLYEHLPDGTTKRTIANGPDGSLWAEYPDHYVDEVDRTGHPPNSTVGMIHKVGNWW